jgi:outer membrane protein assembly factor BamA
MKQNIWYILIATVLLTGCSTTSHLEDDEQLFIGLKHIDYAETSEKGNAVHLNETKEEIEAALATAPNGALFGSSYYRTPFPYGLWIWNAYSHKDTGFAKWMTESFGKAPVLMQNINPPLRTSVAESVMKNNGYFNGKVTYDIIEGKPQTTKNDTTLKPRKAKIQYHVDFGHLFTIDTLAFKHTFDKGDTLTPTLPVNETASLLKQGEPFSIEKLENERQRIYNLLRNEGYYYYQPSYTIFLADTINAPGKVRLQVQTADSLPSEAMRKWVIGSTTVQIKRQFAEIITDSLQHRFLKICFGKPKPPIRPRIILSDTKLRPGMLFSQDAYEESINRLSTKGVFSSVDISFTPRRNDDGTYAAVPDTVKALQGSERAGAGILDMMVNTILDKPYDLTFQANVMGKTSRRLGPGVNISLGKRNAFRGGEMLNLNAGVNYEFQLSDDASLGSSYDFSLGATLNFPRLVIPKLITKKRRWYTTPSTLIDVSGTLTRRAGYFNRIVFAAEYTYVFQPSATSMYRFTPLSLSYGYTTNTTDAYKEKMWKSAVGIMALEDEFIPKMRYTYIYTSPEKYRNPIYWSSTLTLAGNVTNLLSMAFTGQKWGERNKKALGTPFSQFVKIETEIRKTWTLGEKDAFVFHFYGGLMGAYGNDNSGPFSELLYISGFNDLRAFTQRSIGPGNTFIDDRDFSYLFCNGDMKLVLNLEYRPHLFGSLYGALFLDAGNIWYLKHDAREIFEALGFDSVKRDIAVNTGIGIRYDLDYFVLRLDWGIGLHVPYITSSSGFFNIPSFKKAQCLNFSIGYPF